MFAIPAAEGAYLHHQSFAAAAGTDGAHEEAIVVGKSLALTGWEMVTDREMLDRAQKQWREIVQN